MRVWIFKVLDWLFNPFRIFIEKISGSPLIGTIFALAGLLFVLYIYKQIKS